MLPMDSPLQHGLFLPILQARDYPRSCQKRFLSPVSISAAFSLLAQGCRASSQAQVPGGLAFSLTDSQEDLPLSFTVIYFNSGSYTCHL